MSEFWFTAEMVADDFCTCDWTGHPLVEPGVCDAAIIAARANQLLEAHLNTLPVVYDNDASMTTCSLDKRFGDTHTARLWNVQPKERRGG